MKKSRKERKKYNVSKQLIKQWNSSNKRGLCMKFHFEYNNEKYQLSTIKIENNPIFKLNKCLEGDTFWNRTNIFETMILKLSEFTGIYSEGYYIKRHKTKQEATERHKILKNLIENKKFTIVHSINDPKLIEHMVGEFIFEE